MHGFIDRQRVYRSKNYLAAYALSNRQRFFMVDVVVRSSANGFRVGTSRKFVTVLIRTSEPLTHDFGRNDMTQDWAHNQAEELRWSCHTTSISVEPGSKAVSHPNCQ